ncbi:hypothetical protein ABPG72_022593 [Tetrahymena utriculariae]
MKSSFGQTQQNQITKGQVPFRGCFFFINSINMLVYMVYIYAIFYQVKLYPWYQLAIVITFSLHSLLNVMSAKNLNQKLLKIQKFSCFFIALLHFVFAVFSLIGVIIYHNSGEETKNLVCTFILFFSVVQIFIDAFNFKYFRQLIISINRDLSNQESESFSEDNQIQGNDIENQQQVTLEKKDSQQNVNYVYTYDQYLLNGIGFQQFL